MNCVVALQPASFRLGGIFEARAKPAEPLKQNKKAVGCARAFYTSWIAQNFKGIYTMTAWPL